MGRASFRKGPILKRRCSLTRSAFPCPSAAGSPARRPAPCASRCPPRRAKVDGTVAPAVTASEQADCGDATSPSPLRAHRPLGLRKVLLPTGCHRAGGPLVLALRPVVPRYRGAAG